MVDLQDPLEIRYLKAMLRKEFPTAEHMAINSAVAECSTSVIPFQNREKLLECARGILENALSS